jgi:hypothetical protein
MSDNSARVIASVVAGVIPGRPDPQYTRQYVLTEKEWSEGSDGQALAEVNGRALGYAGLLMLQPDRVNWVRTEWVWL